MKMYSCILVLLFAVMAAGGAHAATIDGIVATVNGKIILQSDWEDEIRYEAFLDGKSPDQITLPDRKAALDRLIDQELLRQQMRETDSAQATEEEINNQIRAVRKQYPSVNTDADADTDKEWASLLHSAGLSETEFRRRIALQLKLAHLVDIRLRPAANVSSTNIESYYNQQLLPQLRQAGAKEVPLADVTVKIKELLIQKRIDELLISWLQTLHSGSEIRMQPDEFRYSDQSNE